MAVITNNANGGTDGVDVTTGNSGGASGTAASAVVPGAGGTIQFTNVENYKGTLCYEFTAASGVVQYAQWTPTNSTSCAFRAYFRFSAWPTTGGQIFLNLSSSSGANVRCGIVMNSTGELRSQNAAGTLTAATAGTVPLNEWLRFEIALTTPSTTTGTMTLNVYRGDGSTPIANLGISTTGENYGTAGVGTFRIGKQTSANAFPVFLCDDIAFRDSSTTSLGISTETPTDSAYLGQRGKLANMVSETVTTVPLPTGSTILVGSYLVARIAADNMGAGGIAQTLAIDDDSTNTWTITSATLQDPATEGAGVVGWIAYTKVVDTYDNNSEVDFTFGVATVAKAIIIDEITGIDLTTPLAVAAVAANGASTTPSVGITPLASGQLVLTMLAIEGPGSDSTTEDTDTTNGSWEVLDRVTTDDTTPSLNVSVRGAIKRVSGTSAQTWNPTITSRDWAALAIVFAKEYAKVPGVAVRLDSTSVSVTWTHPSDAPDGMALIRCAGHQVNDFDGDIPSDPDYDPTTIVGATVVANNLDAGDSVGYTDSGITPPGEYTYWLVRESP